MARSLLFLALCLGFPHAQQRVLEGRRTACVQQASRQADHAPEHDWRRAGGGTTRAIERRSEAWTAQPWALGSQSALPLAALFAPPTIGAAVTAVAPPRGPNPPLRI